MGGADGPRREGLVPATEPGVATRRANDECLVPASITDRAGPSWRGDGPGRGAGAVDLGRSLRPVERDVPPVHLPHRATEPRAAEPGTTRRDWGRHDLRPVSRLGGDRRDRGPVRPPGPPRRTVHPLLPELPTAQRPRP